MTTSHRDARYSLDETSDLLFKDFTYDHYSTQPAEEAIIASVSGQAPAETATLSTVPKSFSHALQPLHKGSENPEQIDYYKCHHDGLRFCTILKPRAKFPRKNNVAFKPL
jgi:hypothetical protein